MTRPLDTIHKKAALKLGPIKLYIDYTITLNKLIVSHMSNLLHVTSDMQ